MVGITSFGAYLPRLRLKRRSVLEQMGWFSPGLAPLSQGERSFCNWDEDALTMAVAAARDCLIGKDRKGVDGIYLSSTTLPFADRLNAGILKTCLNLPDELQATDVTSTLRAGTTGLLEAILAVKSGERTQVLVAASDKRLAKAAHPNEMLLGDGAAALLVGKEQVVAEFLGAHSLTHDFVDHYRGARHRYDYTWEERWLRDEGYGKILPQALEGLMKKLPLRPEQVDRLIFPCPFPRNHRRLAAAMGFPHEKIGETLQEVCGETGAAHPLLMLVHALEQGRPGETIVVLGFGQGCDALAFRVTEGIHDLPPREGISGSIARKSSVENYPQFLVFRELLETEMGIRAEAPTQTAMTVLWRKRDMLLGLVGGRCTQCGTPQFPRMDICVNPECRAHHTQEPYEFAEVPAHISSFTGDHLAVCLDPPAVYGMVQFEGGGRFMADFTDCELGDLRVGQPVRMALRKRYDDEVRGFTGYFWKAVPQTA